MDSDDSLSDAVNGIKIKAFPVQAAYSLVLVVCKEFWMFSSFDLGL